MAMFTYFACTICTKSCFRSYRYAGYKQYTKWIHNGLGKGMRKVIPYCTIWAIRNYFPSENQEDTPFTESNILCPERRAIARAHASTRLNQFTRTKIRMCK